MLLRAYLPKLITALFGGLFIAAGVLTFGNAFIFDRLYIGILIFTAIVCRKDINVLGLVAILALERVFEESVWFALVDMNLWVNPDISIHIHLLVYPTLAYLLYRLRFDGMSKFAMLCLGISVCAEIYWRLSNYQNSPAIYWYNILIAQNLLVRYGIFSRIEFSERFFNKEAKSINLDWSVHQITRLYILVDAFNILEYLLRHTFTHPQILYVYHIYPYFNQALATFTLWVVFSEANKLLNLRLLKA